MKDEHLKQYLIDKQIENASARTIDTYDKKISRALEAIGKPAVEVTQADVLRYLGQLRDRGVTAAYINGIYRSLSGFFNWMDRHDIETKKPMVKLKAPKVPIIEKRFLEEKEFKQMLYVSSMKTFTGRRNTAWLWLLWTTGARLQELVNLKLGDLDWKLNRIHVLGKGRKPRFVPFTKEAQKAMFDYLRMHYSGRFQDMPDAPVWLTEERKPMQYAGWIMATRRIYERAGIKPRDMHHIFRRTWAWRQLKAGHSTKVITLIGGWESTAMLDRYVKAMTSEDVLAQTRWA